MTLVFAVWVAPHAWSLDGARIVFAGRTADHATNIYVTTPEGAWFEQLTARNALSGTATYPAWSHDGSSIAFSYDPDWVGARICLMDADGENQRPISEGPHDWGATWSPRDDEIAFSASRMGDRRESIYVADLNGGREIRLTGPGVFAWEPSWRPVGDVIAYSSRPDWSNSFDLHTMDGQGGNPNQLTDHRLSDTEPAWHPHQNVIAFSSWDKDSRNADIYTIHPDGSRERRVTAHPSSGGEPRWSPNGAQILFKSTRDGVYGLFIMRSDGRVIRRVMDKQFLGIQGASWSDPDVPRSVSPIGRRATTWGWLKRLGGGKRNP